MCTYPPEVTRRQLNLLDSHDTPRFISMAGEDPAALRLATLVQMTLPGAPCIYYGDEVGLPGGHDPDCRRGYPWDGSHQDRSQRDFVRGLIALRRSEPLFRHGRIGQPQDLGRQQRRTGRVQHHRRCDAGGNFIQHANGGMDIVVIFAQTSLP